MTDLSEPPVRVLFLHGLEGHPNGTKVLALRAQGFAVEAPDMGMGLWRWDREHAVVRQLPRLGEVRAALALVAVSLALGLATPWSAVGVVIGVGWLVQRRRALIAQALSRSFDDCVRVAAEAAAHSEAEVLVGSSWGGAVALELVASGRWTRPAILLAPALGRVHRRGRRTDAEARLDALRAAVDRVPVQVFHDPTDDVVPFADSEALVARCGVRLAAVDGGGHRLLGLVDSGALARAIAEAAGTGGGKAADPGV